jgi:hypothetical protein
MSDRYESRVGTQLPTSFDVATIHGLVGAERKGGGACLSAHAGSCPEGGTGAWISTIYGGSYTSPWTYSCRRIDYS